MTRKNRVETSEKISEKRRPKFHNGQTMILARILPHSVSNSFIFSSDLQVNPGITAKRPISSHSIPKK